ncbi:MAG TPA: Bro-N domain-containing protein [Ktedonobacterales bacterium]|jgi:prophage antirepressor-like protein
MSDERNGSDQDDGFSLDAFYDQASERIRHVMHNGEPYYSVIDVIVLLTESAAPQQYWRDTKHRMADEMSAEDWAQTQEKILPLKMQAADGKQRLTDAANEETLLRIVQSIPSPKAEPFKQWLAKVGHERLQEMGNPELAADRMRAQYRRLGYTDEWIDRRLQGIVVRDELTSEWHERGAQEGKEFGILTEELQRRSMGVSTSEHKQIKKIGPRQNLRDSETGLELALTAFTEEAAKELHQAHESQGFEELHADTEEAGDVGGAARRDLEARTGRPVVSSENYKTLRQGRQRELQSPLFPDDTEK